MKNLLLAFCMLFVAVGAQAQPPAGNRVEAQRAAFITQKLNLTVTEAQQFWPVYNEYTQKMRTIRNGDNRPQEGLDNISEAEAEKMILAEFDKEQRELELRKEYYQKLKKVLPTQKIVKLYGAEKAFRGEMLKQLKEVREQKRDNRRPMRGQGRF